MKKTRSNSRSAVTLHTRQKVFELDTSHEVENLSNENFIEWDSLAQLTLVSTIQDEFSMRIKPKDFQRFTSFQNIYSILEKMGY